MIGEKKMIVRVHANGKVEIIMEGFTGTACTAASASMEAALGGVASREEKPEYYDAEQQQGVFASE